MWYPAQQQNSTDQIANFFWLIVIFFGLTLVLWFFERKFIVAPIFWIRIHEISIINYVVDVWVKIAGYFNLSVPDTQTLQKIHDYMKNSSASEVSFDSFKVVNHYVGRWIRFPAALILLVLAAITGMRHNSLRFRNKYEMEDFRKLEVQNWPQITPVLSVDLLKQDVDTGPWAMAKLPLDFCKEHHLLTTKQVENKTCWGLLRGPASRVLAMQLGPLWKGISVQPIHIKALLAIFIARAEKDRASSKQLLHQIAASAASGQLDFSGVEELIQKHSSSSILSWIEGRHAYVYTVMATLLEIGRSDGVLASAEFLWLKPLDRRLWYVLNSVGRQTAVVETAGAFAHWLAEKKIGRALKTPMVKEAVNGLEQAVEDILYVAEGEKWRTNNAA